MKNEVAQAILDIKAGKMIILVDGADRENEGDLVMAAEKITPKAVTFMATHGRGLICVPLTQSKADIMRLSPAVHVNTSKLKCNFTVAVDAVDGITTGISAYDRSHTIKLLASVTTKPSDLARPGHVFPLVAASGGLAQRLGHTEGSVTLIKLAGMSPVSVICEIMGDDGRMLHGASLRSFAKKHSLKIITIQALTSYLKSKKNFVLDENKGKSAQLIREVESYLPTKYGDFRIIAYTSPHDNKEHLALLQGKKTAKNPPLLRIHSECLTGDVFTSVRCDCNFQAHFALSQIAEEGRGIFIYLRQEGRGIGLINKLKAYNLQDKGLDTAEANEELGFAADEREYDNAIFILKDLGIKKVRLMTNNPEKIKTLEDAGIQVTQRIPVEMKALTAREKLYLETKKHKLGHLLSEVS